MAAQQIVILFSALLLLIRSVEFLSEVKSVIPLLAKLVASSVMEIGYYTKCILYKMYNRDFIHGKST